MNLELDHLDQRAAEAFDGYLVRKDLVRRYARQYPVPTYVVEFLLGRYCATTDEREIEEGLAIVERQLADRTVRTGDEELFKARARDQGSIKLIDVVRARLDAKTDSLIAELPSLAIKDVRVDDDLVKQHERMLTDGFYAEVTLSYDAAIALEKNGRPFAIDGLRAIQLSRADLLDAFYRGRRSLTSEEWRWLLLRSVGLEPESPVRAGATRGARAHGAVRRAELQPGGAWASWHRKKPPLPADFPLCASHLGRQGDGGEDVRQQCLGAARARLPVRRGVFRRDFGRLLRPEGRRQHSQGLHGIRRVLARQGEHSSRGRRRDGGQPRRRGRAPAAGWTPPEPPLRRHARRYGVHGSYPRLRPRMGLPEAESERTLHGSLRSRERLSCRSAGAGSVSAAVFRCCRGA